MHIQERTPKGADKVTRYGWTRKNEPGELAYVAKERLNVDPAYQRDLKDNKRKRIASNFNWVPFGVITVSRRPDGSLWVIEGQHRLAAAMSRSDIKNVPVIIFDLGGSIMNEATDFLITNTERKALTGIERFNAQIASGDGIAIAVQEMVHNSGRIISSDNSSKSVQCISTIYNCMINDASAMKALWPLICELCESTSINNRFVWGLHYLETRLVDQEGSERSVLESANRQKLQEAGITKILQAIGDASAYYHRGGETIFARGILNVLNYRRRNLLRIRGSSIE